LVGRKPRRLLYRPARAGRRAGDAAILPRASDARRCAVCSRHLTPAYERISGTHPSGGASAAWAERIAPGRTGYRNGKRRHQLFCQCSAPYQPPPDPRRSTHCVDAIHVDAIHPEVSALPDNLRLAPLRNQARLFAARSGGAGAPVAKRPSEFYGLRAAAARPSWSFCHTVLAFDTSAVGRVVAPGLFLRLFNGETAVMISFVIGGAVLSACSDAEADDVCGICGASVCQTGAPSGCGALLRRGARAVPQLPASDGSANALRRLRHIR
jgi:hypothetical protein